MLPSACGAAQPLSQATLVYCDNISTVYLSTNPFQQARCRQRCSRPPHPDDLVRRYLHEGTAFLGVSVQSQHLQWLEFQLQVGVTVYFPRCVCWGVEQPQAYMYVFLLGNQLSSHFP
jgi:hypothetical protein